MNKVQSAAKVMVNKNSKRIIHMYKNERKSLREISSQLGLSRFLVRKVLTSRNIKIDTSRRKKKYSFNERIFKKINNEQKAYWLGFIYADGSVNSKKNQLQICLSIKDEYHLIKFRDFVKSDKPFYYHSKKGIKGNTLKYVQFVLNHKDLYSDLLALGVTPNKGKRIKFPFGKMPTGLIRHFVRGFIDGDGCIHKPKKKSSTVIKINSNKQFLEGLKKVIPSCIIPTIFKVPNKDSYYLSYNSKIDNLMIYNYLYFESKIYLNRKKQVFLLCEFIKPFQGSETKSLQPNLSKKESMVMI